MSEHGGLIVSALNSQDNDLVPRVSHIPSSQEREKRAGWREDESKVTARTFRDRSLIGGIVLYCIALHCIALYCIVLYCIVLYCIVLYCIVLYCIVLYCIVLYFAWDTLFSNYLSPPKNAIQHRQTGKKGLCVWGIIWGTSISSRTYKDQEERLSDASVYALKTKKQSQICVRTYNKLTILFFFIHIAC